MLDVENENTSSADIVHRIFSANQSSTVLAIEWIVGGVLAVYVLKVP
jgi:hypothetical protein